MAPAPWVVALVRRSLGLFTRHLQDRDLLTEQIVGFDNAIGNGLIESFEILFRIRHLGLKRVEATVDGGGAGRPTFRERRQQFRQTGTSSTATSRVSSEICDGLGLFRGRPSIPGCSSLWLGFHKNPFARAFHIFVLAAFQSPEEGNETAEAKEQRGWDEID